MIDPQTVMKILDAADIVDVVSDFVSLRRRGVNYIGLCPFHDEKTGSFTVSPAKGICKCFGCGKGGSPVNFIMEHEQLDYPGALRYLAKKYNITIEERELTNQEKANITERESLFAVNEWAKSYFASTLKDTNEGRNIALSYFRERGISDASIEKFSLGYCLNDFSAMITAAKSKGYKDEFLLMTGLAGKSSKGDLYDRFKGRVMFPVHTLSGKIVAFGGRILQSNDKMAKYVNSPESLIYHKSNELYGIFQAKSGIVKEDKCYLVEGYTDVISMHQSGITNVVASSGTALTHGQIRMIHRLTHNITVIYDGDNAGIKASLRGINLLLEEGMNVKVVLLPDGEDPDSYAREHNAADFVDFIGKNELDFIHFKINLLMEDAGRDPIKRAKLIQDIAQSIAVVPDQIIRSVYIKECARLLDMHEAVIIEEISKLRNKVKIDEAKKQGFSLRNREIEAVRPKHQPAYRNEKAQTHNVNQYPDSAVIINYPPMGVEDMPLPEIDQELLQQTYNDIPPSPPMTDVDEFGMLYPPMDHVGYEAVMDPYMGTNPDNRPTYKTNFIENEKEIMSFVVRHGEELMLYEKDDNDNLVPVTVGQFVLEELLEFKEKNGTYLNVPIYDTMMNILCDNIYKPDFRAFRCFVNYPDPNVSMTAAELLSDKYQLSKIFTQQDEFIGDFNNAREVEDHNRRIKEKHMIELKQAVTKAVLSYKYNIVVNMRNEILDSLKQAEQTGEIDNLISLLKRLNDLNAILNQLAPLVGKRVINI